MNNENTLTKKQVSDPGEGKWKQRSLFLVAEGWFQEQAHWYLGLPETEHLGEFEDVLTKEIDLRIKGDAK
jgi:hypothetical protein